MGIYGRFASGHVPVRSALPILIGSLVNRVIIDIAWITGRQRHVGELPIRIRFMPMVGFMETRKLSRSTRGRLMAD